MTIVTKTEIDKLADLFEFHVAGHEALALTVLRKVAGRLDFRLKLQKASIQLIDAAPSATPFAVLGFRRTKPFIFLEFYGAADLDDARIVQTIEYEGRPLHRIHIATPDDVTEDVVAWVVDSAVRYSSDERSPPSLRL